MPVLKSVLSWLAVVAAVVSAILWFWAARGIKVDAADFGAFGGATPEAVAGFDKQARLNGYAATATGVSALLQAVAMAIA